MPALTANDILRVWETGHSQHAIDRALTLAAFALPEMSREELASLTIGQRDRHILDLREDTFGSKLSCFARCPACRESLEFALWSGNITAAPPDDTETFKLEHGDFNVTFRLPNSHDLAAIARCDDVEEARGLLVGRCVLQSERGGASLEADHLPQEIVSLIAHEMAENDPQAEIVLDLSCPQCEHKWQTLLDIESYFWSELIIEAKRLLTEVHILARAYGWSEAEILGMSAQRRRWYLELVGA